MQEERDGIDELDHGATNMSGADGGSRKKRVLLMKTQSILMASIRMHLTIHTRSARSLSEIQWDSRQWFMAIPKKT